MSFVWQEKADLSDKDYVERCRDGHQEDFKLLVDRYQRPVFSFLAARLHSHSEAEEAAQESFVRAFFSLKKLRKPDSFYSWILGIASHVAQEHFRDCARRRECETTEALAPDPPETHDNGELEEAIAALPENYRQVILLRYYEGLSCQEVANRLDTPLHTVTKRLSRAYALLRQELAACEGPTKRTTHELR